MEAKGLCERNHLYGHLKNEATREKMNEIIYDRSKDLKPTDVFGPLTKDSPVLPKDVRVEWISKESDIKKLEALLSEPYIGVDAEWKPNFGRF